MVLVVLKLGILYSLKYSSLFVLDYHDGSLTTLTIHILYLFCYLLLPLHPAFWTFEQLLETLHCYDLFYIIYSKPMRYEVLDSL